MILGVAVTYFSAGLLGLDAVAYGLGTFGATAVDTYVFKGGSFESGQKGLLGDLVKSSDVSGGTLTSAACGDEMCNKIRSNLAPKLTRSDLRDEANNFTGTTKLLRGDCAANKTLAECAADPALESQYNRYNSKKAAPGLHPAGVMLYRTDSYVTDVPAKRMDQAARDGGCRDTEAKNNTRKKMADCLRKNLP